MNMTEATGITFGMISEEVVAAVKEGATASVNEEYYTAAMRHGLKHYTCEECGKACWVINDAKYEDMAYEADAWGLVISVSEMDAAEHTWEKCSGS